MCSFFNCPLYFSNDEDEELQSTDPETKEKSKDKKTLCKVKWSRDEVSLSEMYVRSWEFVGTTELDTLQVTLCICPLANVFKGRFSDECLCENVVQDALHALCAFCFFPSLSL